MVVLQVYNGLAYFCPLPSKYNAIKRHYQKRHYQTEMGDVQKNNLKNPRSLARRICLAGPSTKSLYTIKLQFYWVPDLKNQVLIFGYKLNAKKQIYLGHQ